MLSSNIIHRWIGIYGVGDINYKMNCPKCGHIQVCPCTTCNNWGKQPWVWDTDGNISCGKCLFKQNADEWLDLEFKQYNALVKKKLILAKAKLQ